MEKGNGIVFATLPRCTAIMESSSNRTNALSVEKRWVFGSISFGYSDLL